MSRLILVADPHPSGTSNDAVLSTVWERVRASAHPHALIADVAEVKARMAEINDLAELVIIGHGSAGLLTLRQATTKKAHKIRWKRPANGSAADARGEVEWKGLDPTTDLAGISITLIGCSTGGDGAGPSFQEGPEFMVELARQASKATAPVCSVTADQITADGDYLGSPVTIGEPGAALPPRKTPLGGEACTPPGDTSSVLSAQTGRALFLEMFPASKGLWSDERPVVDLNRYLAAATLFLTAPVAHRLVTFMVLEFSGLAFLAIRYEEGSLPAIILTRAELREVRSVIGGAVALRRRQRPARDNRQGEPRD